LVKKRGKSGRDVAALIWRLPRQRD